MPGSYLKCFLENHRLSDKNCLEDSQKICWLIWWRKTVRKLKAWFLEGFWIWSKDGSTFFAVFFFKRLKFYKLEKSTKNDQNLLKKLLRKINKKVKFSHKNNLNFSLMIFMKRVIFDPLKQQWKTRDKYNFSFRL
jgi:hypothetical protein